VPRYIKAQCEMGYDTGADTDVTVNTFYFKETTDLGTDAQTYTDIIDALADFYHAFDQLLSPALDGSLRIKLFNHLDPPPRSPVAEGLESLTLVEATGLPNEVSVALSYRAALESGQNRRRNRGRVYIGPLGTSWSTGGTGDRRPLQANRQTVIDAYDVHLAGPSMTTPGADAQIYVFSRSDALGLAVGAAGPSDEPDYTEAQLIAGYHLIDNVWMDDAFDTQRRRGVAPTSRVQIDAL